MSCANINYTALLSCVFEKILHIAGENSLKGEKDMYHDDRQSLKETGQKGDFLLPFVAVNTIMPDFYTTYPMHWHEEMEIVFVEKGEYEEFVDLEKYHVKQGDIILVNPCVLHSFRNIENKRTVLKA